MLMFFIITKWLVVPYFWQWFLYLILYRWRTTQPAQIKEPRGQYKRGGHQEPRQVDRGGPQPRPFTFILSCDPVTRMVLIIYHILSCFTLLTKQYTWLFISLRVFWGNSILLPNVNSINESTMEFSFPNDLRPMIVTFVLLLLFLSWIRHWICKYLFNHIILITFLL